MKRWAHWFFFPSSFKRGMDPTNILKTDQNMRATTQYWAAIIAAAFSVISVALMLIFLR